MIVSYNCFFSFTLVLQTNLSSPINFRLDSEDISTSLISMNNLLTPSLDWQCSDFYNHPNNSESSVPFFKNALCTVCLFSLLHGSVLHTVCQKLHNHAEDVCDLHNAPKCLLLVSSIRLIAPERKWSTCEISNMLIDCLV